MTPKKILILRHVPHEDAGTLEPLFRKKKIPYSYVDVWKKSPRLPQGLSFGSLLVMGGPMGAGETRRYPFLQKEIALIRRAVNAGRPVVGICLGSQLIAKALGARVFPNRVKEIGWDTVTLTPTGQKDPLLGQRGTKLPVFQWHGDTFTLPQGAQLLASSPRCRRQAFRYKKSVYGFQFHLEVDPPLIRRWLSQPLMEKELAIQDPQGLARIRQGYQTRYPPFKRRARPFLKELVRLLHQPH